MSTVETGEMTIHISVSLSRNPKTEEELMDLEESVEKIDYPIDAVNYIGNGVMNITCRFMDIDDFDPNDFDLTCNDIKKETSIWETKGEE